MPTTSGRPLGGFIKRAVRAITRFYVRDVTQQASSFNLKSLDVSRFLLKEHEELRANHRSQDDWFNRLRPARGLTLEGHLVNRLCHLLAETEGRVLVADSPDAALVDQLEEHGIDCLALAATATDRAAPRDDSGADLRFGDPQAALAAMDDGCLGGALLLGFVDTASPSARLTTLEQVLRSCRPGAPLLIVTQNMPAWEATQDSLVIDIAPGRPFEPNTWQHVLKHFGCEFIDDEEHSVSAGGEGDRAVCHLIVASTPTLWQAARHED